MPHRPTKVWLSVVQQKHSNKKKVSWKNPNLYATESGYINEDQLCVNSIFCQYNNRHTFEYRTAYALAS